APTRPRRRRRSCAATPSRRRGCCVTQSRLAMRRDIELRTEDGTLLRGFVHTSGDGTGPGIVMAHGFSGVKEQIDHYAAFFAEAGFSVLLYDHRGFGESDGEPRLEVDPYRQISDWRDAISYAATLPDAEHGLGIWGSSFAGGLA